MRVRTVGLMRKSSAVIACVALCALAPPTPASAQPRNCTPAGAGVTPPNSGAGHRQLHTWNLSCRKGVALMKAFDRRHGSPSPGSFTTRIKGFRCKASFGYHAEGLYGSVVCRKGIRRVEWSATGLGSGGGGAPD